MCHCAQLSSISLDERVAAVVCMYTHIHVCARKLKVDVFLSLCTLLAETETEISLILELTDLLYSVSGLTFVLFQLWDARNTPFCTGAGI